VGEPTKTPTELVRLRPLHLGVQLAVLDGPQGLQAVARKNQDRWAGADHLGKRTNELGGLVEVRKRALLYIHVEIERGPPSHLALTAAPPALASRTSRRIGREPHIGPFGQRLRERVGVQRRDHRGGKSPPDVFVTQGRELPVSPSEDFEDFVER
jgi:hypothetical protein